MIRHLDPDPLHVEDTFPEPATVRSEWRTVIALTLLGIVGAFVLGYVVGRL